MMQTTNKLINLSKKIAFALLFAFLTTKVIAALKKLDQKEQ